MCNANPATPALRPSHTKIVATVGPACDTVEKLVELLQAGVDVFRLNAAHGSVDDLQRRLDAVREASRRFGQPVGVLTDLAGPKMRLGELAGGAVDCHLGQTVVIARGEVANEPGVLVTTYGPLLEELTAGARVLLADGTIALEVEAVDGQRAACRVVQPGIVRSRQGINLPGLRLSARALGDHDRENAVWAARAGVDFLGLSFVRTAAEIVELRELLAQQGGQTQIIAKIEKPEAVENLAAIIDAADGVMVARGDLGVEIDIARLPMVQKEIVAACHRAGKPVIVATQMLDSMQHSRLPTRAETTDVANAILDGADACMLSGETAIGEYPRESVEMMHRIALATEPLLRMREEMTPELAADPEHPITDAVTFAAALMAEELDAKLLVVATSSGKTALRISKQRRFAATLGVSENEATIRRMCLYWGVIPLASVPTTEPQPLLDHIITRGRKVGWLAAGDRVVIIGGGRLASSRHNIVAVHEVAP